MEIKKNGFKNVRLGIELDVYVIDGKEWFDVRPMVELFGFRDLSKLTDKITEPCDKATQTLCTLGGKQEVTTITEAGLYEIIFSISQRNVERHEKSRMFKRWVFDEVLPSLRKSNFYVDKDNINKNQLEELKEYLFDLCESGKISLGKASKMLFGNESELKKRFINLGWINYDNCTFEQKKFKASNEKEYELFVCNMSGTYEEGVTKHQLQVSLTNAGYVWVKYQLENNKDLGTEILN